MKKYANNVEYKNDYNRQNYDQIALMIPKGMKELWKAEAKEKGLSLNAYIIECVKIRQLNEQLSENDETK